MRRVTEKGERAAGRGEDNTSEQAVGFTVTQFGAKGRD